MDYRAPRRAQVHLENRPLQHRAMLLDEGTGPCTMGHVCSCRDEDEAVRALGLGDRSPSCCLCQEHRNSSAVFHGRCPGCVVVGTDDDPLVVRSWQIAHHIPGGRQTAFRPDLDDCLGRTSFEQRENAIPVALGDVDARDGSESSVVGHVVLTASARVSTQHSDEPDRPRCDSRLHRVL